MPLTHVCVWAGKTWKHISITEAVRMHPGGTVSAKSGLFMCDLCGQYVTLTWGDIRDPYFRHSSEEKSKDCPERSFGAAYTGVFHPTSHSLPIRLKVLSEEAIRLEVGLLPIPDRVLAANADNYVLIQTADNQLQRFRYSLSRILNKSTTYLSVGSIPSSQYRIALERVDNRISSVWPTVTPGITGEGTLFDAESGQMLAEDGDAIIGKEYLLLTKHKKSWIAHYSDVTIETECSIGTVGSKWNVFKVIATGYSEDSARFFLDYHARLTANPTSVYPIWPVFIEKPFLVLHREDKMFLYLKGEGVRSDLFPEGRTHSFRAQDNRAALLVAFCNDRQQILSVGRSKTIAYTYLWKDALAFSQENTTKLLVTDDRGEQVQEGKCGRLPDGALNIHPGRDGFVEVENQEGEIEYKASLTAGQTAFLDKLSFGITVRIYEGLDCCWSLQFQKIARNVESVSRDEELYQLLTEANGNEIAVPHAMASVTQRLERYPKSKKWIVERIHKGKMPYKAILIIRNELMGGGKQ